MLSGIRVLVVDDSAVFRETLARTLAPHCSEVLVASGLAAARERLLQNRDLALVVSDASLPDGSGFELLDFVQALDEPRPRVILVSARTERDEVRRATDAGAIGYLSKPTTFREIARVVRQSWVQNWNWSRPLRRRSLGKAFLKDPRIDDANHLAWDIRDVSVSGALLETKGPLEVGSEVDLCLVFGAAMIHVEAEIVRVQEPTWARVGGVGVRFKDFYAGSRELLERYIHLAEDDLY